jgi:hypothetical protein
VLSDHSHKNKKEMEDKKYKNLSRKERISIEEGISFFEHQKLKCRKIDEKK